MTEHKNSNRCLRNFDENAGAMEKECAQRMWGRSEDLNDKRYTTFISDGNSSAYNAVSESDPYPDHEISKVECINHVSKRLVTRLMKLKKETVIEQTTKSGATRRRSALVGETN